MLPDGTSFEHRVTEEVLGDAYALTIGEALPVVVLEVRIASALLEMDFGTTVMFGNVTVDKRELRTITVAASDDPSRVVRSARLPRDDAAPSVVFEDLPLGPYRCCFVVDRVVQREAWVTVAAGVRAEALLGPR